MKTVKSFQITCPANPRRSSDIISDARKSALRKHWGGKCAYCGSLLTRGHHFDHVIDGPHYSCHHNTVNLTWNTVPSCANCNADKGNTAGNWINFLRHIALDVATDHGFDINATINGTIARFTSLLYTQVVGFEADMLVMPSADSLKTAYVMVKDGTTITTVQGGN